MKPKLIPKLMYLTKLKGTAKLACKEHPRLETKRKGEGKKN